MSGISGAYHKRIVASCLIAAIVLLIAATSSVSATNRHVYVGIPPQAYVVERIAGDSVTVEVLLSPGQSPHTYEPTPKQIARLAEADLYFAIGLPFEHLLLAKFNSTFASLHVVNSNVGIPLREMDAHHHHDEAVDASHHGYADGASHHEGDRDPHFWMSPRLMKTMAATIADSLAAHYPELNDYLRPRLTTLDAELDSVDAAIGETLAPYRGRGIYVFHPAFGYFTDAYGLRQIPVEVEGKEPSIRQMTDMLSEAEHDHVRALFAQPEFVANEVRAMAHEMGAEIVILDPLAQDYSANLLKIAQHVADALKPNDEAGETGGRPE